jgi:hypothetical protein
LSAAASGAIEFTAWAKDQDIDVAEFTDEACKIVTTANIKAAVFDFVRKGYSQIILYFAGHGMLLGPESEVWWLSGAPKDSAEAVNLVESTLNARGSGVSHIVWISDACRMLPTSPHHYRVRGVSIFPNPESEDGDADVDFLYASRPGEPALEAKAEEAGNNYRALFTSCLLDGLWGRVPEVIEVILGKAAVPSWTLKSYLKRAVPRAAAKVQVTLRQTPDIRAESHLPMYLALLKQQGPETFRSVPSIAVPSTLASLAEDYGLEQFFDVRKNATVVERLDRPGIEFGEDMERILKIKGRSSFETRTGFTVVGQGVQSVTLHKGKYDRFEESGAQQISVETQGGDSALIEFEGGTGTCLAVLRGYIGTVLVEDGRVVNVNYTPSRGTYLYPDYQGNAEELNKRRAFAAVAARKGYFHLDKKNARLFTGYIRQTKALDPTLGLYAVYAYAQAGLFREIQSVFDWMIHGPAPSWVPFDIALLARKLPDEHVANICPMITQGWSMLGAFLKQPSQVLEEAARCLIPSLWTTLTSEGVAVLRTAIERGDFR